jgi:hypothetical protein
MTPNPHGFESRAAAAPELALRSVVVALMLLLAIPAVRAQRVRPANDGQGIPVATNRILQTPAAYYGKLVTLSAGVERVLSNTAFIVDQQGKVAGTAGPSAIGKPILVLAPYLNRPVDPKAYLIVRGEVVRFDPTATIRAAPDYKIDVPPEAIETFRGQPVVVANSVIDSARIELGKKPLRPPMPEELALGAAMKRIAPALAAAQTAAKDSNADEVAESVATLKIAFEQTEAVWDDLGQAAAAEWARVARDSADALGRRARSGNWDGAKTAAGALNRVCESCHTAYRERMEDGSFRIRAGSF